ncbi:glycosyltransferase [Bacteroidetes/Chlorobi group bacterium ChocPot_Mid]|jgi:glycosyltransferase involved in cell wall biosynthesis|nr:MAG: glycosyltransferase [Bacteroidetes/Chlorobi group bacterium ChocPot_Mid]
MEAKKVLVISYYYPPMGLSGVQRTLKFVKYLPKYNWEPIVLTGSPETFYAYDETLTDEEGLSDIKVYRTDSKKSKKKKIKKFPSWFIQKLGRAVLQTIYQPDSKKPWLKKAIKKGEQIISENKIDVIFATAPPFTDFLVALALSDKFDIPFVIDYRDVWIDNPFHFFATPFHKIYSNNLERKILYRTEKAIVTTRFIKELLLKRHRFISHKDIEIIHQGFDPDDFNIEVPKKDKNKFIITHSGVFQDNRTPKYFLKAVSEFFKNEPDAKKVTELRFIGVMRKKHLRYIKRYKLKENTVTTGYITHKESIKQLLESDVLWLMLNDNVRSPGKLYEYFAAKKPILACLKDGIMKKQVQDSEIGFITEPKDVKAIANEISKLYKLWKTNSLPIPSEEFVNQFDRVKLTANLARVLEMALEV